MEVSSKLLVFVKTVISWAYHVWSDRTSIELVGLSSTEMPEKTLLVRANENKEGNLRFGITTNSVAQIEVLRINIDYSAPLQLFDPERMGFFRPAHSNDRTFPFRLYWEGTCELQQKLINLFALTTQLPDASSPIPVRISIYARTSKSLVGRYVAHGKVQVTSFVYSIRPTHKPLLGFMLPPEHTLCSTQPYLTNSAVFVATDAVGFATVLVHEQFNDGTVNSKLIDIPGQPTPPQKK